MDLGLAFDDSDFERKEKTTAGTKTSYNAKVCSPLWFEEEGADPNAATHQLKFSADYHFHQGNYEAAATKYRKLLEMIPESNMPMRQDVQESLCRSYTKLNRHRESTDIAYKLVEIMRNEDEARQRQSLLLLSQSCKGAGDWTGCVSALEELASQQSHYAHFWLELGRAYRQYFKDRGDSCQHLAQIVTCYVRARMLLESVLNTVGQLTRERNETTICKIDEEIKELGVSKHLVDQAAEGMRADLEHNSAPGEEEENSCVEKVASFSADAFRKKWFAWAENLEKT